MGCGGIPSLKEREVLLHLQWFALSSMYHAPSPHSGKNVDINDLLRLDPPFVLRWRWDLASIAHSQLIVDSGGWRLTATGKSSPFGRQCDWRGSPGVLHSAIVEFQRHLSLLQYFLFFWATYHLHNQYDLLVYNVVNASFNAHLSWFRYTTRSRVLFEANTTFAGKIQIFILIIEENAATPSSSKMLKLVKVGLQPAF